MTITLEENEILVLKTVNSEGKAFFNGFQYPLEIGSVVTAPDWKAKLEYGHGLHGLPWGEGYPGYLSTKPSALWILIAVNTQSDYVRFSDKCKFRSGRIEFVGNKVDAVKILQKYAPASTHITFANQIGSDNAVQAAGDDSTQASGHLSTQTADNNSNQTAGNNSTQTAGDDSTQTAGIYSVQIAGDNSTQTAGKYSTQTARNKATQTAGIGTVQICRYYIGSEYKVCTRIITEKEANKPYFFEDGIWTKVKG